MLSPTIHGTMPPLHLMPQETHRVDRFFVLSFNRYRGSLFVVSPDEITLVDNYYALPGQTLGAYLRGMEPSGMFGLSCVSRRKSSCGNVLNPSAGSQA
jgi:hypothetical protein